MWEMWYEFECPSCKELFELKLSVHEGHEAKCPKCDTQAQRIYTYVGHYYDNPKPLYNKDGSYEDF